MMGWQAKRNYGVMAMKTQWTEHERVEAVMKATGASADEAREYLVAEEGSVEDAVISYEGDKLHAGAMR
jgi:NACalpha-BTF3-like transcription factor